MVRIDQAADNYAKYLGKKSRSFSPPILPPTELGRMIKQRQDPSAVSIS